MKKETQFTKASEMSEPYSKVEFPVIGNKYHLSWAYKGARFKLTTIIDAEYCEVNTGQRNKTIRVKIADLLELRSR